MDFGEGRGIVYLEGMFRRMLAAVVILILQALQKVLPSVSGLHIDVVGIGFAFVRLIHNLIRQCQQTFRNGETALIVDTTVDVAIVALGMAGGGISVKLCLRQGRSGNSCTIAITLATAAIEVE